MRFRQAERFIQSIKQIQSLFSISCRVRTKRSLNTHALKRRSPLSAQWPSSTNVLTFSKLQTQCNSQNNSRIQQQSSKSTKIFKKLSSIVCSLFCRVSHTPNTQTHAHTQEWYLFNEEQCCPTHVLTVRAIINRRTTGDDD